MTNVLVIDPRKCTNCRLCELACSLKKDGQFSSAGSRIRVNPFPKNVSYIPLACFQCGDAPCAQVCPTRSLTQSVGLVSHDDETCIGCRMCMLACPFGVISYNTERGIVAKCDTCDGEPECVRFCPTGALEYTESQFAEVSKAKDFARRIVEAAG